MRGVAVEEALAIAHRKELEFATLRPPSRKTPYPQGIVVIQGRRSIPPPDTGPAPHFFCALDPLFCVLTPATFRTGEHIALVFAVCKTGCWV